MKKMLISGVVVLAMLCSCFTAFAAVGSEDAAAYLEVLNTAYADSFLVDFDGDGNDELLIWDKFSGKNGVYEVWQGGNKIYEGDMEYIYAYDSSTYYSIARNSQYPNKLFLRYYSFFRQDAQNFATYTIENGQWVMVDTAHWAESYADNPVLNPDDCWVNDKKYPASFRYYADFSGERDAMNSKYTDLYMLNESNSALGAVVDSIDMTRNYKDEYGSMTSNDKKELFENLLGSVIVSKNDKNTTDFRYVSEDVLIYILEFMTLNSHFPFRNFGGEDGWGGHVVFSRDEFTALTKQLFGRTLDYDKWTLAELPDLYDYKSFLYKDDFYLMNPQAGYVMEDVIKPQKLYSIGKDKYCAIFKHLQGMYGDSITDNDCAGLYSAIVKKNDNGSWTLLTIYKNGYVPSNEELAAYVEPSDWAMAEVEAAEKAGLIPSLDNQPGWRDVATRLHFAQLVVKFIEKTLNEKLDGAPENTFTDCTDISVRKANKIGIINGVGDKKFAPNDCLTREQLATMLWRAIDYIQAETKKTKLKGGNITDGFADVDEISDYAVEAVASLMANGIMRGTSDTEISPKDICTVEQSVLLVYRTFRKIK